MEQRVEVSFDIPSGCLLVDVRKVKKGEWYIDGCGEPAKWELDRPSLHLHPILYTEIQVPDFIKPGWWIARDANGRWWAYDREPKMRETAWDITSGTSACISYFANGLEKYDHIDWKQTKRRKSDA